MTVTVYDDEDVNEDGIIDLLDIIAVAQRYGTSDLDCDMDYNDLINLFDLIRVAIRIEIV